MDAIKKEAADDEGSTNQPSTVSDVQQDQSMDTTPIIKKEKDERGDSKSPNQGESSGHQKGTVKGEGDFGQEAAGSSAQAIADPWMKRPTAEDFQYKWGEPSTFSVAFGLPEKHAETGEPSGDQHVSKKPKSEEIDQPKPTESQGSAADQQSSGEHQLLGDQRTKLSKALLPKVVIFYGAFGTGKPVMVNKISEVWGYVRLHILELIDRVKKYENHRHYEEIQRCYRDKLPIAPEILCDLVLSAMEEFGGGKFLLDDFPQSDGEIREFITLIQPRIRLVKVFYLKCCTSSCVTRAMGHEPTCHQEHVYSVTLYRKIAAYYYQMETIIPYFRGKEDVYMELFAGKPDCKIFEDIAKAFATIEPDIVAPAWVDEEPQEEPQDQ